MKVLLVQPPFTIFKTEAKACHPPLGLAYLAAILKEDHEVSVLDALAEGYHEETIIDKEFIRYGLSFEDIKRRIEDLLPDVVGVSCLFSAQSQNVRGICRLVKEVDDRIVTVVGGAHPSTLPEEMLEDENVDFAVIGEGEETLRRLTGCLEKKDYGQIRQLNGIGFKDGGRIKINRQSKYLEDLDSLPFPYWDIFPLERYFAIASPHGGSLRQTPFFPMITSRGCPFECIFCSVHNLWGRVYRRRSAENVLTEMGHLMDKFSAKEILFEDDNLTYDKKRAKQIFQGIIDGGLKIGWSMPNGVAVQTLDDGMLELMKMSGCHSISIGVESGDEYVLREIIRKPIRLEAIKPVINKAKKLGLETTAFFVVGFPGETRERLKNTFRFAEGLGADNVNFFFATPLPGTRLQEVCKEKGMVSKGLDYSRLKSDYPVFATDAFSVDELRSIVFSERVKLYLLYLLRNPGNFFRKVIQKFSSDPRYFTRFFLKYLKVKND